MNKSEIIFYVIVFAIVACSPYTHINIYQLLIRLSLKKRVHYCPRSIKDSYFHQLVMATMTKKTYKVVLNFQKLQS